MPSYLALLLVSVMIQIAVCFTDTFIISKGLKFAENVTAEQMNSISELQCAYSCFANKSCCAMAYSSALKACLITTSYNCCPLTESDESWDIWTRNERPRDCSDHRGASGIYFISPDGEDCGLEVFCDMETDGGGWTVFQRRFDGTVDFYVEWLKYEVGFGDLNHEFWMGNAKLHKLTSSFQYTLRVDLGKFNNETRYAKYDTFFIGSAEDKYRLHVSGLVAMPGHGPLQTQEFAYIGNLGANAFIKVINRMITLPFPTKDDALQYHDGMQFTTRDLDNDMKEYNCAYVYNGAWWFKNCLLSHLNGEYLKPTFFMSSLGLVWEGMTDGDESLKSSKMMIRRKGVA